MPLFLIIVAAGALGAHVYVRRRKVAATKSAVSEIKSALSDEWKKLFGGGK